MLFEKTTNSLQNKNFVPIVDHHLVKKIGLQVEVNVRYGSVIIDIGLKAGLDVKTTILMKKR